MGKQYWLKIIRNEQLDILNIDSCSGMSWKSMEKVRKADSEKTYSSFNAYKNINRKDEMLFKIINEKTMYKGEISSIEWKPIEYREKEYNTGIWVHFFHFKNIQSLGERDLWANKEKLSYLRKFTIHGFAHKTGMWKLTKDDFETIVNNFI